MLFRIMYSLLAELVILVVLNFEFILCVHGKLCAKPVA